MTPGTPGPTVAAMPTEPSVDRLYRRLTGADPDQRTGPGEGAEPDPNTVLPRWLPEADTDSNRWRDRWAAVRADPGRAGVIGLAVVGILAVLVTVFTLVRDKPMPVVSAKLPPVQVTAAATSTARSSSSPGPESGPAGPGQPVVVSVVGLVKAPGLITVASGARVADVIAAAGGVVGSADTVGLNMARRVADGEQVVVGLAPAPGRPPALGSSISAAGSQQPGDAASTPARSAGVLDLNTATAEQLDALPGIGPVTAAAIVSWRSEHGPFTAVDQLGDVDGIGPARLDKLRALVRV